MDLFHRLSDITFHKARGRNCESWILSTDLLEDSRQPLGPLSCSSSHILWGWLDDIYTVWPERKTHATNQPKYERSILYETYLYTSMALSGHIFPHIMHAVHSSLFVKTGSWYPWALKASPMMIQSFGQNSTQYPHPLQNISSITISPLLFAILQTPFQYQ